MTIIHDCEEVSMTASKTILSQALNTAFEIIWHPLRVGPLCSLVRHIDRRRGAAIRLVDN